MKNFNINEDNKEKYVVRKRRNTRIIGLITGIVLMIGVVSTMTVAVIDFAADGNNVKQTTTNIITTIEPQTTTRQTVTTDVLTTSSITTTSSTSTQTSLITSTEMTKPVTSSVITETEVIITEAPVIEETYIPAEEPTAEYIVFKPSTHYVHKNTCRWFDSGCYEIESTEGIESRLCSECNPDIEVITPYQEPVPQPVITGGAASDYVTDLEYIYLCNTVAHEYGSDWISLYDKACVVAVVMNRVRDGGWTNGLPSTVYNVITAPYQFNPSYATDYYHSIVTQSCKDAVDYYFANQDLFPHYTKFWGDGRANYFS